MRPQAYTPASRTPAFPRPLLDSTRRSSSAARGVPLRRLVALAMALLLMPVVQGEMFAQQAPDNGQYAPDQQSIQGQQGYPQPGYAQPQPYEQGEEQGQEQGQRQQSYPQPAYPPSSQTDLQQGYGQRQPLRAQDLEQLVAPIALYPDVLVAQVLTASTYPAQVADADRWRRAQGYAYSDQIAAGADVQPWDPSVKALTAFPQVLAEMDQNLQWTSELGNAYYNQPQDVLEAVQVMRQRAQAAGNLQSTPQQAVNYEQGNIVLAPVNPQTVYVPVYNPWAVYGQPVSPYPGFSLLGALGSFFGSSAVRFGLGIAMTAFTHTPWGWLGWGLNWLTQSVLFHQSNYYSHSATVADWGLPHGGPRAFSQRAAIAAPPNGSSWTQRGYGSSNGWPSATRPQAFARTPDRNAYAGNRPAQGYGYGYNRAYHTAPGAGYTRPSQETFNRIQPPVSRPQYGRSSEAPGSYNRSPESYGGRAGAGYGSSMRTYSAPRATSQRGDFALRSSRAFTSKRFAESSGKRAHSGGFHLFGGGHAPRNSGGRKSFSHGHSGGGGHFGGHSGGKHHR
jgi:hypothetical protein